MGRRVARVVVGCVLSGALLMAACGADEGDSPTTARFAPVLDGLCAALADANSADADGAHREFEDVHTALHELASEVEGKDRDLAGKLLRAKQKVETDAASSDALSALLVDARQSVRALGGSAPNECP